MKIAIISFVAFITLVVSINLHLENNRLTEMLVEASNVEPIVITETKYSEAVRYVPIPTGKAVYVHMHPRRLKYVIKKVLTYLDVPHVDSYTDILLYTALVESGLGIHIKQMNGPALSPFQVEPSTEKSIKDIYLKRNPVWQEKIQNLVSKSVIVPLETNLEYAISISVMVYLWRHKNPPKAGDWKSIAEYHKKHYNTSLGKANASKGYKLAIKILKGI